MGIEKKIPMTLSQLVIRREIAEEMKALGVRQKSYFYWHDMSWRDEGVGAFRTQKHDRGWEIFDHNSFPQSHSKFAAFSSGELGEMLPEGAYSYFQVNGWRCSINKNVGIVRIKLKEALFADGDTEADARAGLLIYLIKEKLVSIEEINRRLGE